MPEPRLPMRKVRDVLRLSAAGMSKRKIAASLGMSATAARDCIWRARRAGLGRPLPADLTDEELECRLYLSLSELFAGVLSVPRRSKPDSNGGQRGNPGGGSGPRRRRTNGADHSGRRCAPCPDQLEPATSEILSTFQQAICASSQRASSWSIPTSR